MPREYWDTCLFINYLANKPEEQAVVEIVDALLRNRLASASDTTIVVSAFVIAELPPRDTDDVAHVRFLDSLFQANRANILVMSCTPAIARRASLLGGQFPALTPPDRVHLASALAAQADVFLTLDGSHTHGRRRRGDILEYDGKIGLPIMVPTMPPDTQIRMPQSTP